MSEKINSSPCCGLKTWQDYKAGKLSAEAQTVLEEHLLSCENCLGIYLGMIEEGLEDQDTPKLGEDFTDRLFDVIEQEKRWQKASVQVISIAGNKAREVRSNKVNLLISYCAAASISMFFWVGGYFDGLSGNLTKGVDYIHTSEAVETKVEPQRGLIQTGWTKKVIEEERPSFIENLKLKKE